MLETFQNKHPILGLKALARAETTQTRHDRINQYVGDHITHQATFNKEVAGWMFYHPGISQIDAEDQVRETMVQNYLDKTPGGDFRAVGRMLAQAKAGVELPPELQKVKTELEKVYPEIQKKRRKALAALIAALLLGTGISTADESTKGGLRQAPGY